MNKSSSWFRRVLALLAVLAPIHLASIPSTAWADEYEYGDAWDDDYYDGYDGDAADGPGTRFRKCRAQAWADYNECLMEDRYSKLHQAYCFTLWDLDNIGCDLELIASLGFPFSFLWK